MGSNKRYTNEEIVITVHQIALAINDIFLLENLNLSALAARK